MPTKSNSAAFATEYALEHTISNKAFENIKNLIYKIAGISLSETKKPLVAGRLNKRLRALSLENFQDYYKYLISEKGRVSVNGSSEMQLFTDLLTTNETYFFRESQHFDFFVQEVLNKHSTDKTLKIWSAASSSGEEGYTLCMLLAEHLGETGNWSVLGTDISSRILNSARQGVFNEYRARMVPVKYRNKYLLKGTGSQKGYVAIVPELRKNISFAKFNLVEDPLFRESFDVIFCRNVLIYFDQKTKQKVVSRLSQLLKPKGFLITGRSESLHSLTHHLQTVQPSIYQKTR